MNKYILISSIFLFFIILFFFYCMSIETYKNYKNEYDAVKKLKYINRVFFKNKGKLYTEKSIKFTENKINDGRSIYGLLFNDKNKSNEYDVISITNLILPKYNKFFKPNMKRIDEIIIGIDKQNKINKLYIGNEGLIKSVECNDNECKKKLYYEDIIVPVKELKKRLNIFYKDKYTIFDKLGLNKNANIHIKTEKGEIKYCHVLLYEKNIILGEHKNTFKNFIKKRYPKLKLNNVFEKYKKSEVSYFSIGSDGITLYVDQKFI